MYFVNCQTVAQVKTRFRELAMQHHPDRGGDTRTMQIIIEQYHAALKRCDQQPQRGADGKDRAYTYNPEAEADQMRVIMALLSLDMANCEIWLIGSWVWVRGDTKPHREQLKALKMQWNQNRSAWYWRPPDQPRTRYNKNADFAGLAAQYGARLFEQEEKPKRSAAFAG